MTSQTDPDDSIPNRRSSPRVDPMRRGLWLIVGILAVTSLLLTSRDQLPAAPVLIVVIAGLGFGLWWLADHGGRIGDRPLAAPLEALGMIAAVIGAVAVFWVVFGMLE